MRGDNHHTSTARFAIGLLLVALASVFQRSANAQAVHVVNEHAANRQVCRDGRCFLVRDRDLGTGVVISRGESVSHVLTAAHVVRAQSRAVTVEGWPARVVAADSQADVALLEVSARFDRCASICVPNANQPTAITVVGLGGNARQDFNGRMVSATQLDVVVRDGDSGSPVYLAGDRNDVVVGLVSAVGDSYTRIVPAQTLERFVSQVCPQCVCPPSSQLPLVPIPLARLPPMTFAGDVPDAEKTARIRSLESKLLAMESQLSELRKAMTTSEAFRRERGPAGPTGPPGNDGRDGKDAKLLPITVQLEVVDDEGKVISSDQETYQPGEPIKLRFKAVTVK